MRDSSLRAVAALAERPLRAEEIVSPAVRVCSMRQFFLPHDADLPCMLCYFLSEPLTLGGVLL
jgi:hypothetical protein